jgi:hypothetical protein
VSDNTTGAIHLLDAVTMKTKLKSNGVVNPSRLAYDSKRNVFWCVCSMECTRSSVFPRGFGGEAPLCHCSVTIIHHCTFFFLGMRRCVSRSSWSPSRGLPDEVNDKIVAIDASTGVEHGGCAVDSVARALSLSYHSATDSLVAFDGGPKQQLFIFDASTCVLRETVGEPGGVFGGATPGSMGPLKFYGVTGAGMDAAGALYVVSGGGRAELGTAVTGGGTNLVKLVRAASASAHPTGWNLTWQRLGLTFTDNAGGARSQISFSPLLVGC